MSPWASGDSLTPSTLNRQVPSWASSLVSSLAVGAFNVRDYGAVGDGSTDDTSAISNCINAASTGSQGLVLFPAGRYKYTEGLPWARRDNMTFLGIGEVYLEYGGTSAISAAVDFTNDSENRWNLTLENMMIRSNVSASDGLRVRGVHNCQFRNIRVIAAGGGAGVRTEFTVYSVFDCVKVTVDETQSGERLPTNGFILDARAGATPTSFSLFQNCSVSGVTGDGIIMRNSFYNTLVNVASESNKRNIVLSEASAIGNKFFGPYTEQASLTTSELVIEAGIDNQFYGGHFTNGGTQISGGERNRLVGGEFGEMVIGSAASMTQLNGLNVADLSDSGKSTARQAVYNRTTGVLLDDVLGGAGFQAISLTASHATNPRVRLSDTTLTATLEIEPTTGDARFNFAGSDRWRAARGSTILDIAGTIRPDTVQVASGTALIPTSAFSSEVSLGFYRSAASITKQSYGWFSADFISSSTTNQSLATAKMPNQGQLAFSILSLTSNGAEFGVRSGNTVYRFFSDAVG